MVVEFVKKQRCLNAIKACACVNYHIGPYPAPLRVLWSLSSYCRNVSALRELLNLEAYLILLQIDLLALESMNIFEAVFDYNQFSSHLCLWAVKNLALLDTIICEIQ